ncbi:hypothetical protein WN51_05272 [Melipona quadrifasciata]|uniref:Uncharacterized protein n=2 Tax=Melipona TaxID=28651 RepID=A0A0N0U7W0_9HYME|nr:hypothetical protein WN51_05272 [Melipona quadrifasciata]
MDPVTEKNFGTLVESAKRDRVEKLQKKQRNVVETKHRDCVSCCLDLSEIYDARNCCSGRITITRCGLCLTHFKDKTWPSSFNSSYILRVVQKLAIKCWKFQDIDDSASDANSKLDKFTTHPEGPMLAETKRGGASGADEVEEDGVEYYRLRSFSITANGVYNLGDSLKSRRSKSINSVTSSGTSCSSTREARLLRQRETIHNTILTTVWGRWDREQHRSKKNIRKSNQISSIRADFVPA